MAQPIPPGMASLAHIIQNYVKKTAEHFHDLAENLNQENDLEKRRQLLQFFEAKRAQLTRILVLVKWLNKTSDSLDRLQSMNEVLDRREFLFSHSRHSLAVITHQVGEQLYPMWDVPTALHIMSTGSYRLLPRAVEAMVPFKAHVDEAMVECITSRLNDKLYLWLLSTTVPPQFSSVRVENGMVYLRSEGEFEIGVSLRMGPREPEPEPEPKPEPETPVDVTADQDPSASASSSSSSSEPTSASSLSSSSSISTPSPSASTSTSPEEKQKEDRQKEEKRIKWSIFELRFLLSVQSRDGSQSLSLVDSNQSQHFMNFLNDLAFRSAPGTPVLTLMYERLHRFAISLCMDLLHRQVPQLAPLLGTQMKTDYQRHEAVTIKYWQQAPIIPSVSSELISSAASSLTASSASTMLSPSAKDGEVSRTPKNKAASDPESNKAPEEISLCIFVGDKQRVNVVIRLSCPSCNAKWRRPLRPTSCKPRSKVSSTRSLCRHILLPPHPLCSLCHLPSLGRALASTSIPAASASPIWCPPSSPPTPITASISCLYGCDTACPRARKKLVSRVGGYSKESRKAKSCR